MAHPQETKDRARELRRAGASLRDISRALGIATSTASVWVRDLPVPPGLRERASHAHRINSQRWSIERARREQDLQRVKSSAFAAVGDVSDRELLLLGAVLYWAEGSKDKAYDRRELVAFVNSDERVIVMFLRWLDLMSVPRENRTYRVAIHESADLEAAHAHWSQVTGVATACFDKPTIKRHKPRTNRLNVDESYHGCLVVRLRKSRVLYQQIEGLFAGMADAVGRASAVRDTGTPYLTV